jgi:hypothetical protein
MTTTRDLLQPIVRLTPADAHYFYGYYDNPAWSGDDSAHLVQRVEFRDRMPTPTDVAQVGLVHPGRDGFTRIAETTAWTFNFYENSPFTDLDNATAQEDMVYACPDPEAPGHFASSLIWVGVREGFCDLCVAATLEQSLEANPQAPQEVQDAARKALARARDEGGPTAPGIIKAFGPEGFKKLRNEMLKLTEQLNPSH